MKTVFDSSFKYTPSFQTDLRKTFARIRREQQAQIRQEQHTQMPRAPVATLIPRRSVSPAAIASTSAQQAD